MCIVNMYGGNWDWPHNNWISIRRSRVNGVASTLYKWQFFCSDAEGTLESIGTDRSQADADNSPGRLYAAARAERRVQVDVRRSAAEVHVQRRRAVREPVPLGPASMRWPPKSIGPSWASRPAGETSASSTPFTRDAHWLPQINWLDTQFFPQRPAILIEQFKAIGLYPIVNPPNFNQHGGLITPGSSLTLTRNGGLGH